MKTKTLQISGFLVLILISIFLTSCAVQMPADTKITQDQASEIMKQLAGTENPKENYIILTKERVNHKGTTNNLHILPPLQKNYLR